jgi:hypothetical protein
VSKERFGSIVTETLKNRILIPTAISKELAYNGDSKYISFISLTLPIKGYEPEKVCLVFEKREKYPRKSIKY